jgi:hypothetical protein
MHGMIRQTQLEVAMPQVERPYDLDGFIYIHDGIWT